jgi:phospholipase/carboxylesterase
MTHPVEQVETLVAPLLRTLDALGFIARHVHPIGFAHLLARANLPQAEIAAARAMPPWPDPWSALRPPLDEASDLALAAIEALREAVAPPEDIMRAWRGLRTLSRALEAIYPLAGIVPAINRFFLDPDQRHDADLQKRLMHPPPPDTGVICLGDDPDAREAVWLYVPETYAPTRPHPVVFALHGGSGSLGQTWAIQSDDRDSTHLSSALAFVRSKWTVDPTRILLTGMSDGGTFSYSSGLGAGSPFTHLAPVAAAFHPVLTGMADPERIEGLPIHILHGVRDWMFPVAMAQEANAHLTRAGASVTYREIADLSHTYGADLSTMILDWLLA